ncbi:MAG: carbohydrate kinase [Naasia sp.]|nr:carbohydrate kinase [Naasia sp.]
MPSSADRGNRPTERPEPVTPAFLRDWPLPEPSGSKHDKGDVLVIGGARRTPGAAMLAGISALRVGAGRLTIAVGESTSTAVAVAIPESGVAGLAETSAGAVLGSGLSAIEDELTSASVILAGPGLDDPVQAAALIRTLAHLAPADTPIILDAYALGPLRKEQDARERLAGRLMLTPNTTEAEFLLGRDAGDLADDAAEIAEQYGAVVNLMDIVAEPGGRRWQITTGPVGLATSGSGDVLAGALAGIRARGAEPAQAACWAGYLHAAAGDRLAARVGPVGFLAREVLEELPSLLAELG